MSPHGTLGRYTTYGCRCDECRDAMRAWHRDYIARKATGGAVREYRKHGVRATYSAGCRCDRCRKANREYARANDRRLPANRNKLASVTSVPSAPLIERIISAYGPDYDIRTVAEQLGVARETLQRWREGKPVSERHVDRVSIALGWHPAAIWGMDWYITSTLGRAA